MARLRCYEERQSKHHAAIWQRRARGIARHWARRAGAAALLLASAACRPPPLERSHHDLLLGDLEGGQGPARVASSRGPVQLEEHLCADLTSWGLALEDGDVLTADLALDRAPRLALGGCLRLREGAAPALPASFEVRVEPAGGGDPITTRLPVRRGLWDGALDLAPLAGRQARLRITVALPPGRLLWLRDLRVEDERPALRPRPRRRPRQILLISIDTLREDAIGALDPASHRAGAGASGSQSTTPALDRLAGEAQVWSPHYAAASWTKPSHASLLTGELAEVHGADSHESSLGPGVTTLAERFSAAGFRTGGLVHDIVFLDPKFGFDRGFEEYRTVRWTSGQMARAAHGWMTARRDQDFFFFLHLFAAHSDYKELPYEGPGVTTDAVTGRFGVADYGCRGGHCASALLQQINAGLAPVPREAEILRFLYDAGVADLDRALGELFADLRRGGQFDDLLLVVTADHGEDFLEHGQVLHGHWWEEVLRVPLLVKWPRGLHAGERRPTRSSGIDVAPTLLAAGGIAAPDLPGTDLLSRRPDQPVFSGTGGAWTAVWSGDLKAVVDRGQGLALFDLATDPAERQDLRVARGADLVRLAALVERRLAHDATRRVGRPGAEKGRDDRALSDEERARLRALGYGG